ncbi:MAG: dihydroneopterin aldolase [Candidatus Eremiobacteraeota bacterium]|nr:dihydroneopterin aldolase [Candidatus Eremiobacteraeota bacterium]
MIFSTVVSIHGMRFWGKHGVELSEREHSQPIDMDVIMAVDLSQAAVADDVAETVDYSYVYERCADIVTGRSFALLESLAAACLEEILRDQRIAKATVRLRKPRLLEGGTPQVELSAERS